MICMLLDSVLMRLTKAADGKDLDGDSKLQRTAFDIGFRAGSAYTRTLPYQQLSDTKLQIAFISLLWEALFGPEATKSLGKASPRGTELVFENIQLPLPVYELVVLKDELVSFYCSFIEGCISGAVDSLGLLGNANITQVDGLQVILAVSIMPE